MHVGIQDQSYDFATGIDEILGYQIKKYAHRRACI